MKPSLPEKMKTIAIDRYGGPEVLHAAVLPVPRPAKDEVLIRLEVSGIGVWDPAVREGDFEPDRKKFPYVIGNDGAGVVVAKGGAVKRFAMGDHVYAYSMEGGFYAEYVAVKDENVAKVPSTLPVEEAGALGADGITALRGLDELRLKAGEKVLVYGASGGIGHLAVQLALRLGAKVLAAASGPDGVALVRRLGADVAVDGRRDSVVDAARQLAPNGLDAALVLTGGEGVDEALAAVKQGGRLAYPNGVEPEPRAPQGVEAIAYDGIPSPELFDRLNRLVAQAPFHVELSHLYKLDEVATAHRELAKHHLGKLAIKLDSESP